MSTIINNFYHLVEKRPWPLLGSLRVFLLVRGLVKIFFIGDTLNLFIGLISVILIIYKWWQDVVRERTLQGLHYLKVIIGLQIGILLFITSEVLFFFRFFWGFFHRSLSVTDNLGRLWPPVGVVRFDPFDICLLNTAILLASGVSLTWSHHRLLHGNYNDSINGLVITILLGIYFTLIQGIEYIEAMFSISDRVYGSVFYVATGFHGLHVIIGRLFLLVCLIRIIKSDFSINHHIGYEASIWYWHFVDIVWLFLYRVVYWWGA